MKRAQAAILRYVPAVREYGMGVGEWLDAVRTRRELLRVPTLGPKRVAVLWTWKRRRRELRAERRAAYRREMGL